MADIFIYLIWFTKQLTIGNGIESYVTNLVLDGIRDEIKAYHENIIMGYTMGCIPENIHYSYDTMRCDLSNKMRYETVSDQPSTTGIQPNIPFRYVMGHDGTNAFWYIDIHVYKYICIYKYM